MAVDEAKVLSTAFSIAESLPPTCRSPNLIIYALSCISTPSTGSTGSSGRSGRAAAPP